MRENMTINSSMETLSFKGFQNSFINRADNQKSILFSVSSNVYYGYQPFTTVQHNVEPMLTDDFNKSPVEMDTTQLDTPYVGRKRTRTQEDIDHGSSKKRRQHESQKHDNTQSRCSPAKGILDEDLLRETHGCSYYHWVASNI